MKILYLFKGNGKQQTSSITGQQIANGGPKGCVDTDECKFNIDDCDHGQFCFNTVGSFTCYGPISADPCTSITCSGGGLSCGVDPSDGQAKCIDVNECLIPGMCNVGTHCVNLHSTFACVPDS